MPSRHSSDLILYFAAPGLILDKCSGSAVNCGHSYILTAFRKKTFVQFAIFFDCDLKALTSSICGDFLANYPQQSKGLANKNWTVECKCSRREKMRPSRNCILYI